jgi:hypothetical protein
MIPSYRVFGANRVSSRHPSLLIAYRVQKRQVNAVPLAPASKERLQKDSKMRRGSLRLAARLAVSVLTGLALSSIAAPTGSPIALLYDPEFRHQRNLSHWDPWQQHRRKLRDSGHHRKRGAPRRYSDWDLGAVSRGDGKRRQLPGSDRFLALWPRLWLSFRHSEGRWQLRDSILFTR